MSNPNEAQASLAAEVEAFLSSKDVETLLQETLRAQEDRQAVLAVSWRHAPLKELRYNSKRGSLSVHAGTAKADLAVEPSENLDQIMAMFRMGSVKVHLGPAHPSKRCVYFNSGEWSYAVAVTAFGEPVTL
jgi:phosphopantothenate synthetase